MKDNDRIRSKLIVIGIVAALAMVTCSIVWAGCYKCTTNNFFGDTFIDENEVTQSEHDSIAAMLIAADQIHCSTSVRKGQGGFGLGHRGGKNAGALGLCQTFVSEGGMTYMVNGSFAAANDVKPAAGIGINWTF